MANWTHGDGINWRPLAPFGVEIDGDLSVPLSAAGQRCFSSLFREHGLILARDQPLNLDQQVALMSLLGPIVPRTDCIGYLSSEAGYQAAKAELSFHADYAFAPTPSRGCRSGLWI